MLAYNLLAFGIFGISDWLLKEGIVGVATVTLIGQAIGFMGGWLWSSGRK